jgi:uncharacterized protein YdhG (YjbR/CyaY superfamily)
MARTDYKSVDEYIASQPEALQEILKVVRKTIQNALPDAEEVISYQIPAYRAHGERVIFFAGWTSHFSIYPATDGVTEEFKNELARYKISKGTIRFPLDEPVPVKLIERIAKFRAKVAFERMKTEPVGLKKRK